MSGERAKRFPLALEDLKRAPRKSAARPNERHPSSPARPTLGASVAGSPARPAGLARAPRTAMARPRRKDRRTRRGRLPAVRENPPSRARWP